MSTLGAGIDEGRYILELSKGGRQKLGANSSETTYNIIDLSALHGDKDIPGVAIGVEEASNRGNIVQRKLGCPAYVRSDLRVPDNFIQGVVCAPHRNITVLVERVIIACHANMIGGCSGRK